MNRLPQLLLLLLLLAVLGISVYAGYQHSRTQDQLARQLQQLDQALSDQTNDEAFMAGQAVKSIYAAVIKNQSQPHEVALLHRAEALELRARQLLDTLSACQASLRRATGNSETSVTLRHPGEAQSVGRLLGPGTRLQLALQQQVSTCADTLRQFGITNPASLAPTAFDDMSVVEALAVLTELQSAIAAGTTTALKHVATNVGAKHMKTSLIAVATAESNIVAPSEMYRGQLLLVKTVSAVSTKMYCNGQPFAIGSNGVGLVRFRAPNRPGPSAWTGTIRIIQNSLDSTFQVRVPYRVARR